MISEHKAFLLEHPCQNIETEWGMCLGYIPKKKAIKKKKEQWDLEPVGRELKPLGICVQQNTPITFDTLRGWIRDDDAV